jgi:hypothetical protein
MILRHMLRKSRLRAGLPARRAAAALRASDIILIMSALGLLGLCAIKILHG